MKKQVLTSAALLMSALITSGTYAADASTAEPFAGFYAGAFAGVGGASFDGEIDSSEIQNGFPEQAEIFDGDNENGSIFGAFFGYNIVNHGWLYGVEVDLGTANVDAKTCDAGCNDFAKHEIDWTASLRGRVGRLFNENRTLVYATAGAGYVRSELKATSTGDANPSGSEDLNSYGLVGGLGIEHSIADNFNIRAEGLYYGSLSEHGFRQDELHDDMDAADEVSLDDLYQIRVGLSYRF